jgi:hypothetical protein
MVSRDSLFFIPRHMRTSETHVDGVVLPEGEWFWTVRASDRAGNTRTSEPAFASFYAAHKTSSAGRPAVSGSGRKRGVPNPSGGEVRLVGLAAPVAIVDATGRRVAGIGSGVRRDGDVLVWDGTIRGRPAPAGLYWAVGSEGRSFIRLIRIR